PARWVVVIVPGMALNFESIRAADAVGIAYDPNRWSQTLDQVARANRNRLGGVGSVDNYLIPTGGTRAGINGNVLEIDRAGGSFNVNLIQCDRIQSLNLYRFDV